MHQGGRKMNNKMEALHMKRKNLIFKRDILAEEVGLQREVSSLRKEMRDLGGDSIHNFRQDLSKFLLMLWLFVAFLFENLLNLFSIIDKYLQRFNE